MTRLIKYGDSSQTVRLEFPSQWTGLPSTITITVKDEDAGEILSAQSATLYTATVLNGAVTRGDNSIIVANDADNLTPGDRVRIAAGASGSAEDVEVDYYNSTSKVATLKGALRYSHADGAAVSPLWATYALNASGSDYTVGKRLQVIWTPNTDDPIYTEDATVIQYQWQPIDLESRFRTTWFDIYEQIRPNFDDLAQEARKQLRLRLMRDNRDLNTLREPDAATPALMSQIALMVTRRGGDEHKHEYEMAIKAYNEDIANLTQTVVWWDVDDDLTQDKNEESSTPPRFVVHGRGHY